MQDVFLTPSILPLFSSPLEVFSCSPAVQGLSIDQPDKRPEIYSALPTRESSSSGTAPSLSAEEAIPHPALVFYRCNLHLSLSCSSALWDGEKLRGGNSLWEAWGAPFHSPFQKQQTPKGRMKWSCIADHIDSLCSCIRWEMGPKLLTPSFIHYFLYGACRYKDRTKMSEWIWWQM